MRIKPTVQIYQHYTDEDFAVWAVLFERQMQYLRMHASRLYLESLDRIGFRADVIPRFSDMNDRLGPATGWQLAVTPELVPTVDFFRMLSQRIFPATCWLRAMTELDYLEEPDMFHDVFGHAPLLMHPDYAAFMEAFGKLALQWLHHPPALQLLSAVYWFTVEFGLQEEEGRLKIFGAGIISSTGETAHALGSSSRKLPFAIRDMMHTPYRTDALQENYFVMHSFRQLLEALPAIREALEPAAAATCTERPLEAG